MEGTQNGDNNIYPLQINKADSLPKNEQPNYFLAFKKLDSNTCTSASLTFR